MMIEYKKRIRNTNLVLGILWTSLSVFSIIYAGDKMRPSYTFHLIFGLVYMSIYFSQANRGYARVEGDYLIKNKSFFRKEKINLKEVIGVRSYFEEFVFNTKDISLRLNSHMIEPNSLIQLKKHLESYQIQGIEFLDPQKS